MLVCLAPTRIGRESALAFCKSLKINGLWYGGVLCLLVLQDTEHTFCFGCTLEGDLRSYFDAARMNEG